MNAPQGERMALGTDKLIAQVDGAVGSIIFNHPERRNAMSLDMWRALGDACEALEADPRVRVVVMRGAGGKAFVSGADISEFEQHRANAAQKKSYGEVAARAHRGLTQLRKPLIAMIEGYCVGGGMALALGADVRLASSGARFGIPAARLGLGYDYDGLAALARLVGPSVAKDMLFSARFIEADEALRIGLVNACVPADALAAHVRDYAQRVAANAPLTVHAAKAAVRLFERYSGADERAEIAALVDRCFDSDDYREGRTAFLEKRTPRFQGH